MRSIHERQYLRYGLIHFRRNRLPDLSNFEKHARHQLVLDNRYATPARHFLDTQSEGIFPFREHHRRLIDAALVFHGHRVMRWIGHDYIRHMGGLLDRDGRDLPRLHFAQVLRNALKSAG